MRVQLTVVAAATLLASATAWGDNAPAPIRDFSNQPVKDTLYATDQHMAFSIRTSLIRWLGGVDVTRERDVKAAAKDGWWGETIPQVSNSTVAPPSQR